MALIKLNNRGVRNVSAFGSVVGGSMAFIKKLTASSSATLSFVDGSSDVVLDNTYKEYLFTLKIYILVLQVVIQFYRFKEMLLVDQVLMKQ